MSYIGKSPSFGSYSMLDNLTASATASYSLTLDSVAFVPESANHLIVSLNGVIQKAGSSFTVSSSTLTFSSALTSSDSIDFILALGNVLDIGTPSDATVTNAKTNFVSTSSAAGLQIKGDGTTDGTLQLNCSQNSHGIKLKSPSHSSGQSYTLTFPSTAPATDKIIKTDSSGNLSFVDDSGGAQTLLASGTVTNQTQVAFDSSLITSTYQIYNLYFTAGARNSQDMRVYYSDDNGSSYCNVDRFYEHIQIQSGGASGTGVAQNSVNASDGMIITKNNAAGDMAQGMITVYKPYVSGGSSARWNKGAMHSRVLTQQNPGSSINIEELRGVAIASHTQKGDTFVVNNFKIFTTGNFDIRYALYGLKLGT